MNGTGAYVRIQMLVYQLLPFNRIQPGKRVSHHGKLKLAAATLDPHLTIRKAVLQQFFQGTGIYIYICHSILSTNLLRRLPINGNRDLLPGLYDGIDIIVMPGHQRSKLGMVLATQVDAADVKVA